MSGLRLRHINVPGICCLHLPAPAGPAPGKAEDRAAFLCMSVSSPPSSPASPACVLCAVILRAAVITVAKHGTALPLAGVDLKGQMAGPGPGDGAATAAAPLLARPRPGPGLAPGPRHTHQVRPSVPGPGAARPAVPRQAAALPAGCSLLPAC
jgi:hypothetical protein